MTVLPDHATMIAELDIGEVLVHSTSGTERFFIAGGYVEVDHNKVKVLADIIEKSTEINLTRAQDARQRASKRLVSIDESTDLQRANRSMKRADVRIMIAETLSSVVRS